MMRTVVSAVQHIRKMRGGSQAHLMRASDGHYYVVKFQNNPQHVKILANEFLGSRLARFLGLPVPDVRIIEVQDCLIASTPELRIETPGMHIPFQSGLQLASRYAAGPGRDAIFDYLPESFFGRVANRRDFASMLAFDKWTGNCDGRQAVFTQQARQAQYHATFIDQGCCFNGSEWTFPDLPLHGVYYRNCVYHDVTGWDSFEPVLSRIGQLDYAELWRCAAEIPHEWFEHDGEGLFSLIETLHQRRFLVRDLIAGFRTSSRHPFPQWTESTVLSVREAQAVLVQ